MMTGSCWITEDVTQLAEAKFLDGLAVEGLLQILQLVLKFAMTGMSLGMKSVMMD